MNEMAPNNLTTVVLRPNFITFWRWSNEDDGNIYTNVTVSSANRFLRVIQRYVDAGAFTKNLFRSNPGPIFYHRTYPYVEIS